MKATKAGSLVLLLALALSMVGPALGDETDGRPVLTSHEASVEPGKTFDLEVTVQAWTNSTHTVTFVERTRFTFPGERSESHDMEVSDAILFKVQCKVAEDTPDGDFLMEYNVTWSDNGTARSLPGQVKVIVGEGAGTDEAICSSVILLAAPCVVAFTVLLVGKKRKG